jgi:thioredoxin reductase (NADPH)
VPAQHYYHHPKLLTLRFLLTVIEKWATDFNLKPGGPFQIKVGDDWYESETVILANGAAAKWLGAPNEDKFINNGISACATCDGPLPVFRKKHIAVLGGGDSAAEEALFLTRFASKVTMIVRRDQLRASKIMVERVKANPKIEIAWNTVIEGYEGNDKLEALRLKNVVTGEQHTMPVAGLFMAIGHDPLTKHIKISGVGLDEAGYIKVHDHIHTNIEGVFAAGDVHDTHFRQAITASGFGCMAAIAAERWLEAKTAPRL